MFEEIDVVQELYETSLQSIAWEGRDPETDFINHCYSNGDLPPGGKKKIIEYKPLKRIVGKN